MDQQCHRFYHTWGFENRNLHKFENCHILCFRSWLFSHSLPVWLSSGAQLLRTLARARKKRCTSTALRFGTTSLQRPYYPHDFYCNGRTPSISSYDPSKVMKMCPVFASNWVSSQVTAWILTVFTQPSSLSFFRSASCVELWTALEKNAVPARRLDLAHRSSNVHTTRMIFIVMGGPPQFRVTTSQRSWRCVQFSLQTGFPVRSQHIFDIKSLSRNVSLKKEYFGFYFQDPKTTSQYGYFCI